jgi:hypothetical protein
MPICALAKPGDIVNKTPTQPKRATIFMSTPCVLETSSD